jgi:hypothetical protein
MLYFFKDNFYYFVHINYSLRILIIDVVDFFIMFDHSSYLNFFFKKIHIFIIICFIIKNKNITYNFKYLN